MSGHGPHFATRRRHALLGALLGRHGYYYAMTPCSRGVTIVGARRISRTREGRFERDARCLPTHEDPPNQIRALAVPT